MIDSGIKAREHVVSVGGLILAQIYEEMITAETGSATCFTQPALATCPNYR